MDKVQIIRYRIKKAQRRQKSYADIRRRELEFPVDDSVLLKISPMKDVMKILKKKEAQSLIRRTLQDH